MAQWQRRLAELRLKLPEVAAPVAAYVPAVSTGNLVYTSGQIPFVDGTLIRTGLVGDAVSTEDAHDLARICALNALAAAQGAAGKRDILRIVKVVGYVASATDFTDQAAVIDGASSLFIKVFGDAGVHARSAVGVFQLPLGAPVEVELIVELSE